MTESARLRLIRLAIEVVADKWRIAVLLHLSNGALRTCNLQRHLENVAPKVLTQTLRGLERDGLIYRDVVTAMPLHVEYRLTAAARPLITALGGLSHWSESYGEGTLLARRRYDSSLRSLPRQTTEAKRWQSAQD